MPRPRATPPSYLKRKTPAGSLRARTVIRWPGGRVEERALGGWGSPESHAAHEAAVGEWRRAWAAGADPADAGTPETVADLVALYWPHVERERVEADGTPKGEADCIRRALRPLVRLFGPTPACEFGPKKLKAVRQAMCDGTWRSDAERAALAAGGKGRGWVRKQVNGMVDRVRRMFSWAVSEELLPAAVADALWHVRRLGLGDPGTRDLPDVLPVPPAVLAATLPELPPLLQVMARVQLLTGMRPGELCRLTPGQLVRADEVELAPGFSFPTRGLWVFVPTKHKTAHKKKKRVVLFGREAQELLAPLLDGRPADAPVFSPAESRQLFQAKRRAARKSRVQPSQLDRRKAEPATRPGERYTKDTYQQAVARACQRAFPPPPELRPRGGESQGAFRARLTDAGRAALRDWHARHRWHVHQLRHNAASQLVKQFGKDVARIVLGHSCLETTEIYALEDFGKAIDAVGGAEQQQGKAG